MAVLIYTENFDGKFKKATYELVSYGNEIANKLGRTELAIKGIVIIKGWAKPKPKCTQDEILMLKRYYKRMNLDKLARRLNRSRNSLVLKMRRLESQI